MKKYGMLIMAAVFVLALSVTAVAQYAAQETQTASPSTVDNQMMVMGTVVSVSDASLVVKTDTGDRMIFVRNASSMIPAAVSPGTAVHVVYDSPSPGVLHVSNVEINVDGSGMSPGNTETTTRSSGTAGEAPASGTTSATDPSTGSTTTSGSVTGGSQTGAGTETMPKTASPLPVIGLVGILALAGGLTLRIAARR